MAILPVPAFLSRTDWRCPDGQEGRGCMTEYTTVTHLIVHHSALTCEDGDWQNAVLDIWKLHTHTNGWDDLGYNFLIDPGGVIYEGRAGGDNVRGAHFICANDNTMGVVLLGDFRELEPTEQAIRSLIELLSWKCQREGIDPRGKSFHQGTKLHLNNIAGHRDGNVAPADSGACPKGTECPGDRLYQLLSAVRATVHTRLESLEERS